jgi:hypothetical protein
MENHYEEFVARVQSFEGTVHILKIHRRPKKIQICILNLLWVLGYQLPRNLPLHVLQRQVTV